MLHNGLRGRPFVTAETEEDVLAEPKKRRLRQAAADVTHMGTVVQRLRRVFDVKKYGWMDGWMDVFLRGWWCCIHDI